MVVTEIASPTAELARLQREHPGDAGGKSDKNGRRVDVRLPGRDLPQRKAVREQTEQVQECPAPAATGCRTLSTRPSANAFACSS